MLVIDLQSARSFAVKFPVNPFKVHIDESDIPTLYTTLLNGIKKVFGR